MSRNVDPTWQAIRVEPRGWTVYKDRLQIRCFLPRERRRLVEKVVLRLGDRSVDFQESPIAGEGEGCLFEVSLTTGWGPAWLRVIVEFPGGGTETVARILGFRWGQRKSFSSHQAYYEFLRRVEPTPRRVGELGKEVGQHPYQPLVSIVLPTYNTDPAWLGKAINSVRAQVYPNWELCIADDASTLKQTREALAAWEKVDNRIKVQYREENGHIALASNSSLATAKGQWIGLLDHDDELAPQALAVMVRMVQMNPEVRFLYSDEDKIDENGVRSAPYLKPDWNPTLLQSQNYICHFAFIRHEDLRAVGGFRAGTEGCQDWDLFLRLGSYLPVGAIRHVPGILYHWRMVAGSTASQIGEKDYVVARARRVLEETSRAKGRKGKWEEVAGMYWVHHPEACVEFETVRCHLEEGVYPESSGPEMILVIPPTAGVPYASGAKLAGWAKFNLHGMVAGSLRKSGGEMREAGLLLQGDGSLAPLFQNIDRNFEGMGRRELLPQNLPVPGRWFFAVRRSLWEEYFPRDQQGKTWTARVCAFALALRSAGFENILVPGISLEADSPTEQMKRSECASVRNQWKKLCERDPGGHPYCTNEDGYLSLG